MNILKPTLPSKLSINKFFLAVLICLAPSLIHAESTLFELPENVQVHGFLSQSFSHSTDNNFLGKTDDNIAADFRELGLNGSWRIFPELQIAAQLVWRDAGETDKDELRLDYGYANYTLFSSESSKLGIKAGRVPTPLGLYNVTRDVAATRPGIFLPQSIYFDINRNLAISADGGYLYGEHRTNYGDFFITSGVVLPRTNDPDFNNILRGNGRGGTFPGEIKRDASWITQGNYEWQGGTVRLGVTYADFNAHLDPKNSSTNPSSPGNFRFNLWVFSAQYNAENWSLTGEYAIRRSRLNGFITPDLDFIGESYYVQGTYKLTSYLEAMLRYDVFFANRNDKNGHNWQRVTGAPSHSRFAKDYTAGLRLEILPSLLLSAEYHIVDGTGWVSPIENNGGTKRYWNLFSTQLSYNF